MTDAHRWLERIRGLSLPERIRVMNVCGGHERSVSMSGMRSALPPQIEIIPGPGCPVCVCPEEDIYEAIQLALNEDITLVAFGFSWLVKGEAILQDRENDKDKAMV